MKPILILSILVCFTKGYCCDICPHEEAFSAQGWVVHNGKDFVQILQVKLQEFIPEIGSDLVIDDAESYLSDFSHDTYLILWIVILDRVSTAKDEMWGDVSITKTGPATNEFAELRWYDPVTKEKHIVCNPDHAFCLTTKVPLAYNTIF